MQQVELNFSQYIKDIIEISKSIRYEGNYHIQPFQRFPTRKVKVGNLYIGGDEPIRIQSMTTTPTLDIEATVKQSIQLFNAGCEIVRITTRNPKEGYALKEIKAKLIQHGYHQPIVADIHFSPETALIAVEYADKVRINPGNFVDVKKFDQKEYTDEEYEKEFLKIERAFKPLIMKLKEYGKSLRIGSNHGSLSDRIMNRFGDTPEGMVESAIEFIKIAEYYDYKDIVVSMKASNPFIMIQAYKMLVERFIKEKMNYPIHLGVTEAGDGKDGRLKSYSGIGLLLLEGIGDTIRVSLTEDPVEEIPAAKEILQFIDKIKKDNQNLYEYLKTQKLSFHNPYEIKRNTKEYEIKQIGGSYPVKWIVDFYSHQLTDEIYKILKQNKPDYFFINENEVENFNNFINNYKDLKDIKPIFKISLMQQEDLQKTIDEIFNKFSESSFFFEFDSLNDQMLEELKPIFLKYPKNVLWFLHFKDISSNIQKFIESLSSLQSIEAQLILSIETFYNNQYLDVIHLYPFIQQFTKFPILLKFQHQEEYLLTYLGILGAGSIFSSIGDLLYISSNDMKKSIEYGSDILQITRLRLSRADFISCPSCGRTLFDLQEVTKRIKEKTEHLKGVKIAIMGCIVNGLGEMADADFGYVGSSPGKVNLYKGKTLIKRNVPEETAPDELVQMIKDAGMWQDPN